MFYVYALYSIAFNKIYIGFTSDIERRLLAHDHPSNKQYTGKFKPWILLYSESYPDKATAMKREEELKSARGRTFIKSLIK